jgi:hypothetical protein
MKRCSILTGLIILCSLFAESVSSQTSNKNIFSFGPKNKLNEKYATLYVIRDDDTLDKRIWFAVMYEKLTLGHIQNGSRNEIHFPLDGKKRFWAQYDPSSPTSGVWLDLEFGKSYYLKMQIVKGLTHGNPELTVLDSLKGKTEFNNITSPTNVIYYPAPPNMPEATLGGNPFNRTILHPFYYNVSDSFYYWKYRFKVPSYFQYVFYSEKYIYHFLYGDTLLSPTYSEFLRVQGAGVKEMKTEEDLLNYVKKSLGDDKGTKSKKLKLVSLNYEPIKPFGDFGWLAISEVEDHKAGNKGENDFLVLRDIRACIYEDTKEKTKPVILLWLSARGTPDELYTLDEMKERLKQFINGWELINRTKSGELPAETPQQKK